MFSEGICSICIAFAVVVVSWPHVWIIGHNSIHKKTGQLPDSQPEREKKSG